MENVAVPLTSEERQRRKELERESHELRRAKEILKAAASAFVATDGSSRPVPRLIPRLMYDICQHVVSLDSELG